MRPDLSVADTLLKLFRVGDKISATRSGDAILRLGHQVEYIGRTGVTMVCGQTVGSDHYLLDATEMDDCGTCYP